MNEEISEKNKTAKLQNLPEGWKWARLAEVVEESLSGEWGEDPTLNNSLYPVISTLAIDYEGNINFAELVLRKLNKRKLKKLLLRKNDILLEKSGGSSDKPAGKVALVKKPFEGTCSNFIQIIRVKKKYSPVFVFYKMFSDFAFRKTEKFQQKTTGIINFKINEYFSEMVPLPPLPEQQKIAEILETVDSAIDKTDQIIEKYKRIKQGLMQELLTKGIDENGKIRDEKTHHFKASPLGRIPEEWKVTRLGEIASKEKYSFVDGPFGSNLKTVHYTTSGILVIQSNYFTKGKFNVINPTFTTEEKANELLRSNTKPSDIVIAKIGANYGAVAIIPETITRAVLSGNTMKITLDKNIANNVYVCFYLGYFKETDKINRILAAGSAQPALSLYGYKNLKIPLPPLPEQQRIAAILSQIDEVIEKETQYRDKLKRLKAGLMQDLLTGKVRVNKLIKQGA